MLNPSRIIRRLNNRLAEDRKVSKITVFRLFTTLLVGIILFAAIDGGFITVNLDKNESLVQGVNITTPPLPRENPTPQPTSTPSSTPIPIPKPIQKSVVQQVPTPDPDPIIDCNFSQSGIKKLRKSECSKSFDCQIGNKWYVYTDRNKCTADQNAANKQANTYTPPSYLPCTVYYPALGYSQTYTYTSPETCKIWQNTANTGSTNTFQPTQQPSTAPTQDNSEYNDLLKQHAEACKQVVAEWNTSKENFYTNEYNNYSSSYEAVQELERRRQTYQQEAYSVGCTQTISL